MLITITEEKKKDEVIKMVKFKKIVEECINGCEMWNAREDRMHFNINYYVNSAMGINEKRYHFVYKVEDLEEALSDIVENNVDRNNDVVIADITIKHNGEILRVNKNNYSYSFKYFMDLLR